MFFGTLTQAAVHPREVVKSALRHNAASVILAHNHPSGVPLPPPADQQLTWVLKQALALVDIKVLDHFIIAGGSDPISFAEHGLMPSGDQLSRPIENRWEETTKNRRRRAGKSV